MSSNKTQVIKDLKAKSIVVEREFNAPLAKVWRAYTESKLLDQWWGPSPWRAETKHMNFANGGHWLYAMVGPENEKHWARMNYISIEPQKKIEIEDLFCDENGKPSQELPVSRGHLLFTSTANGTKVEFKMNYHSEADVQKMIEMGFEQGITQCMDQLEQLFAKELV